jgi:hypothetical protein
MIYDWVLLGDLGWGFRGSEGLAVYDAGYGFGGGEVAALGSKGVEKLHPDKSVSRMSPVASCEVTLGRSKLSRLDWRDRRLEAEACVCGPVNSVPDESEQTAAAL